MFINYSGGDRFIKRAVAAEAPGNESATEMIENSRVAGPPSVRLQPVSRSPKASPGTAAGAESTGNSESELLREIREQPRTLARMWEEGWPPMGDLCRSIQAFSPEWINIAARGT
ncbi:MAG TPA: hypothetical protein VNO55_30090, partial [Polyangia bacterium]|nr:hypothetical protein [Polyangia bacterium]